MKKKHYRKIEEKLKNIFNTEIQKGNQDFQYDSVITIINEPLVRHQIIQLAKLCEEIPVNVTLKSISNGVFIEFW